MQITLFDAVARRMTVFGEPVFSPIAGEATWRLGSHDYIGAQGVDMGPLHDVRKECEWFIGPRYALLETERRLREKVEAADEDRIWMDHSDGCCWLNSDRQFVFEIRNDRNCYPSLEAASRETMRGPCSAVIDCRALEDSGVWWRQTSKNFDAFMCGAPIYFTVSEITLIRRSN